MSLVPCTAGDPVRVATGGMTPALVRYSGATYLPNARYPTAPGIDRNCAKSNVTVAKLGVVRVCCVHVTLTTSLNGKTSRLFPGPIVNWARAGVSRRI